MGTVELDHFQAVFGTDFVLHAVEVIFHRLFGDEQFLADFFVTEALRDQLHNFLFAVAEQGLFAPGAGL